MLSAHALTTIEALKAELSIPVEDKSKDAVLARAVNAASDAIRQYCRREFARSEVTEHLQGNGSPRLMLTRTPVVDVIAVHLWDDPIDLDTITIDRDSGILTGRNVWPESNTPNVRVEYVGGYVTPAQASAGQDRDLPFDIEAACLIIASSRVQAMGQPADAQIMQVEQIRVHFADGGRQSLPISATALLDPYVRWS